MAREGFEFNDFADESIVSVKDDAKRQFIEAGLNEEQAEYNAQFLVSGLSTFAHRAGMTTGELYRALGLKIAKGEISGEAKIYAQPAYHGSAVRDIAEFSTDFIGTGEGARAYGWGLYCAEARETGEVYRKNIGVRHPLLSAQFNDDGTPNRANMAARYINANWSDENLKHELSRLEPSWNKSRIDETIREGHRLLDEYNGRHGQLYRLEIPENDVLLDFDKPLFKQPEPVKKILADVARKHSIPLRGAGDLNAAVVNGTEYVTADGGNNWRDKDGNELSGSLWAAVRAMKYAWGDRERAVSLMKNEIEKMTISQHGEPAIKYAKESLKKLISTSIEFPVLKSQTVDEGATMEGATFYRWLSKILGSDKAASLALDEAGISGHRYLDRLSRDRGEGTHNYVIYDGRNMRVRETYYQAAAQGEAQSGGDLNERTMQEISSANTSLNQVPASFKAVNWRPGATNADIGGRVPEEIQPRGAIDFTNPNAITITLTPHSDATTTIHEMGHLFRWLLERQAEIFPDDEGLQADWKAVRDFGDHEKFADAAIEYAMTGSAPSPYLCRAFDMFRQCLVSFYDAIRGNTGVKLNEEIKGVFDRILKADAMKAAHTTTPDSSAHSEKSAFFQSGREPPPENNIAHTNHKQTKKKEAFL